MIDAHEIVEGIRALAREKKKSRNLAWAVAGLLTFLIILLVAQTALMFKVGHSEIDMGCSYYDSNRIIVNLSVECKFDVASKKLVL